MPLPLAPLVPIALRLGAVAATGLVLWRALAARSHVGRTDQRAEDALDDLGEGFAVHHPADRGGDASQTNNQTNTQTNAAARVRRTIRWGKRGIGIDAALLARLRISRF